MPIELEAHTDAGDRLVAIAEALAGELAVHAADHDRDGSFPFEAIDALKAAGYFAAPVPVELGGLGVDSAHDLVVASSRLARGDASVAIGVNMHLVAVLEHGAPPPGRGRGRGGAPRPRLRLLARADRSRRRRARRRDQRARPGPHAPGHPRHPHGIRLADRRAEAVLHDVPGRHRPLRRRHLRRRRGHRPLRVRDGAHRRARRRRGRRLGRPRHARLRQQLGLAGERRAPESGIRGGFRRAIRCRTSSATWSSGLFHAAASLGIAESADARPAAASRAHQRRRAATDAGGRQRRRPRRRARRPVARGGADRRAPRRQPGVGRQRRASSARSSPRRRPPRSSSTRPPPVSSTARSRSRAVRAT